MSLKSLYEAIRLFEAAPYVDAGKAWRGRPKGLRQSRSIYMGVLREAALLAAESGVKTVFIKDDEGLVGNVSMNNLRRDLEKAIEVALESLSSRAMDYYERGKNPPIELQDQAAFLERISTADIKRVTSPRTGLPGFKVTFK